MATKKKASPKAEKTEFTAHDIEGFTNHINRYHGAGAGSGIAIHVSDPTHPILAGVVSVDADLDGYVIVPCRDRIDGQYTPAEVKEILEA